MKKYIIFDADRTLVDSFKSDILSFKEAVEIVTGKKLSEEDVKQMAALPTSIYIKGLNLTEEELENLNKEWVIAYSKYENSCFPGIEDVIRKLYNDGYILGIITSRTMSEFHELDNILAGIIDCFKIVVTSDKVENHKPSRDSMDYLCKELNCNTEDIIYVGDSNLDKEFAINSNVTFIGVCYENDELVDVENACFNVSEIIPMINKLNGE